MTRSTISPGPVTQSLIPLIPLVQRRSRTSERVRLTGTSQPNQLRFGIMAVAFRRRSTRRSSILATLLSGVMALQLLLGGGGMLCAMSQRDSMAGMQMGMRMASRTATVSAQHVTATGTSADQPCGGDQGVPPRCASMAACAPSAFLSAVPVAPCALRVPSVVIAAPTVALFSHTSAPELPPPRA